MPSDNLLVTLMSLLTSSRMAIEDDDLRDREIWTAVSRYWYFKANSKASDKAPTAGRPHHHLAILHRSHAVGQLFHYTEALCHKPSLSSLINPKSSPFSGEGFTIWLLQTPVLLLVLVLMITALCKWSPDHGEADIFG